METKIRITKKQALAKYLFCEENDIKKISRDTFECGEGEYLVLSDHEANSRAKEYIKESLWAFNKSFLDHYRDMVHHLTDEEWGVLTERCESSNNIVLHLIGINNLNQLIKDAIITDGRGHFLSPYDGEECEQSCYYIYRTS